MVDSRKSFRRSDRRQLVEGAKTARQEEEDGGRKRLRRGNISKRWKRGESRKH